MKKAIIAIIIIGLAAAARAEVQFKDVASDHWAASAVYDLVKMGVTKGYPDGTFRGNKPITRYETAIFLSKLSKSIGGDDLRNEIKELKGQVADLQARKDELKTSGNYQALWRYGNVLSTQVSSRGAVASYQLVVTASKELGDGADIRVNLDTMDFGYFNDGSGNFPGQGLLAPELLDVESNFQLDNVGVKLTYGPGPKLHTADPTGVLPSEIGLIYDRPNTGILASTKLLGADVKGGLYSLQGSPLNNTGKVNASWLTGALSYTFNRFLMIDSFKVDVSGDYISSGLLSSSDRTVRAKVDLLAPLNAKTKIAGTVGLGTTPSKMMVAGSLALNDPWDTGTVVMIKAAKLGSQYVNEKYTGEWVGLAGADNFNRVLENGTVNIGGQLTQAVSDKATLIGRGDVRLASDYQYSGSKARFTAEGGITYNIAPNVNLDAAYRIQQEKGTGDSTDLAAVGLLYKF